MKYYNLFNQLKKNCLIVDIETWAAFADGSEIDISSQFEQYIQSAKVKWFGAYSYKLNMLYLLDATKNPGIIKNLLNTHNVIIGFNSEEFDYPILQNNGFIINPKKRPLHIDCMQILGKSVFFNRKGYAYKNRGELMDYKFKNNSLKTMAEEMKLDFQKEEIDYHIFNKNSWSAEEEIKIKSYLKNDVMATKQIFEKLWDFWSPFTEMLNIKYVKDFSWIKNSIAALTYKAACSYLDIEPTYADKSTNEEAMGGNVLLPKYEEARNVWYVDFASLYPHLFLMFNLFAEITDQTKLPSGWHGNEMFKVRGHYDISKPHKLNLQVQNKLLERIRLKKEDKNNPMVYAIKIFLNGLYGVARSEIFEKLHTPNCGWDCCWLGQQVQAYVIKRMEEFGFETIYGDTDSCMVLTKDETKNNREYVQNCLKIIVQEINANSPFPVSTFDLNIETFIDYILFPFSDEPIEDTSGEHIKENNKLVKELRGKKKNYAYIHGDKEKEIELVGLPIKKDNRTELGLKIYEEVLKSLILKNMSAKFSYDFIKTTIGNYLKQDEILYLISQEYKIKPFASYKNASQIQAQISKEYLNSQDGIIRLIKNNKIGKVGIGTKYCLIEEARKNNLTENELDLTKLWNELIPFIQRDTIPQPTKKEKKSKKETVEDMIIEGHFVQAEISTPKEKIMKSDILKNEINLISNKEIREFVIQTLENAPDYFYEGMASSTGKYHPSCTCKKGGLIVHVKRVIYFINRMCGGFKIENIERDIVLAAGILHDIAKVDKNKSTYVDYENHPINAEKYFAKDIKLHKEPNQTTIGIINEIIRNHMGLWTPESIKKSLDKYSTLELVVYIADYLAATKDLVTPKDGE
jgi:DNA polymerase elongation subunit (family B)